MADPGVDEVLAVISHVVADLRIPPGIRAQIAALQAEVDDSPLLAHEKLVRLATPVANALATAPPHTTLYRAVTLSAFYSFCVAPPTRALSFANFERQVRLSTSPDDFLTSHLDRIGVVFPTSHSWLVDCPSIESKSGGQLVGLLEIRHRPPFVLCRMRAVDLAAAGVTIREPTGLDAAIGLQPQWRATGLPAGPEFVDKDIRGSAIDRAFWRP